MLLKHNLYDITIKVIERIDTQYSGGYTKSNYLCEDVLPSCCVVKRPTRTICDKEYIETNYHQVGG